jgi:post-segregation antitoxin (ccd killing protein)
VAISDATLANNASYGLNVSGAAGATLTNVAFNGNADYALAAEPNTRLLGMTGLTLTTMAADQELAALSRWHDHEQRGLAPRSRPGW